ncbi:unnamed protein product [Meloidogyne enterolobii]|uniref:Uncharacterized protein n=1 Tax=Meloidogyne enterolobii TaxID=390850 RepID=A0ACB1AWG8_MELEN
MRRSKLHLTVVSSIRSSQTKCTCAIGNALVTEEMLDDHRLVTVGVVSGGSIRMEGQ